MRLTSVVLIGVLLSASLPAEAAWSKLFTREAPQGDTERSSTAGGKTSWMKRMGKVAIGVGLATALFITSPNIASIGSKGCALGPAGNNVVVVDARGGRMTLCQKGQEVMRFPVATGWGGVGKTTEGDKKTPLGTYSLGQPRPSGEGFTVFIPVGYPTAAQRQAGNTGGAVGIHGPAVDVPVLGRSINYWFGWTSGCIQVGRTKDIKAVAKWVKENGVRQVVVK